MQKVKEERPDLICLDITMPEESGIRMYRNLKEDQALAHIPVVVVTAVTGLGRQQALWLCLESKTRPSQCGEGRADAKNE